MAIEVIRNCILKGENNLYLIDKGRVLEWTDNKEHATVYDIENATIKQVNWPNTILIREQTAREIKKPASELPEMLVKVKALNLSSWQLYRASGITKSVWYGWLTGKALPRPTSEIKIKQWLQSL